MNGTIYAAPLTPLAPRLMSKTAIKSIRAHRGLAQMFYTNQAWFRTLPMIQHHLGATQRIGEAPSSDGSPVKMAGFGPPHLLTKNGGCPHFLTQIRADWVGGGRVPPRSWCHMLASFPSSPRAFARQKHRPSFGLLEAVQMMVVGRVV